MAVGLVGEDAATEPDDLLGTEVVAQMSLDLLARELRVAVAVQQTLLGGQSRALAVDVDRSALEHQRRPVALGALRFQYRGGDPVVALP